MFSATALLAVTLAAAVSAQFVPTPTDLTTAKGAAGINVRYKEVPYGICELDPNVKSYTGYADVEDDEHIFFWFFEARNVDPSEAPLSVWINGGPGSSSMLGLWQENGPCGVDYYGNVYSNPYSWSNVSNMLYIDQPATVGFSYSVPVNGYYEQGTFVASDVCPEGASRCGTYNSPNVTLQANSTSTAAPNFWKTLQGFMGAFPQYSRSSFHFTTESYGGHYGPVFNEYIEQQNAKHIPGALEIKLETVMIGNGWYDPLIQYQAYYNYTVSPGNTYDYSPFTTRQANNMYDNLYGKGKCVDLLEQCYSGGGNTICSTADNYCAISVEELYDIYSGRDEYDMRELDPDPFPYSFFSDYINTIEVQQAIGAFTNWSAYSSQVGNDFGSTGDDAREDGTVEDMGKLLAQDITVCMYTGDADYNCNWIGGEAVSKEVKAPGFSSAGYVNITTSDKIVHGQVKQSGKFSFVRIYESGHEVPFYQPLASLELFDRAINGKDLATGKIQVGSGYITKGTPKSTYREGNSTIQWTVLPDNATYNYTTNAPNPSKLKRAHLPQRAPLVRTPFFKPNRGRPVRP